MKKKINEKIPDGWRILEPKEGWAEGKQTIFVNGDLKKNHGMGVKIKMGAFYDYIVATYHQKNQIIIHTSKGRKIALKEENEKET